MYRRSALVPAALLAGFAFVAILLFHISTNRFLNHDEQQYVFASLLAVDLSLYRDFIYLQTPFYPLFLSVVFSFIDEGYFYAARVTSFFFSLGSVILMFQLGRRITGEVLPATAIAALFVTSAIMASAFGSTRNDIMPCFFALLGVYLTYEGLSKRRGKATLMFLGGLALAVSVGTKASYVFAPVTVALYCLWPRDEVWTRHFRTTALPLVVGGLVGVLPLIYYMWLSFDNFLYDTVIFPSSAPAYWYANYVSSGHMSWQTQIVAGLEHLRHDGTTAFCILFILFACVSARSRGSFRSLWTQLREHDNFLFLALAALSIPFAMAIPEGHKHYYVPTVPFLLLAVAAIYTSIRNIVPQVAFLLFLTGTIVFVFPGFFRLIDVAALPSTVATVQSISGEIRRVTLAAELRGKIATLSPIFVIDAGLPVFREFSAGPFFFRTGDMLSSEQIGLLNGVSPNTLEILLDNDPPVAVFVGYEANKKFPLDARLERYARQRGYVEAEGNFGRGTLFLKPAPR